MESSSQRDRKTIFLVRRGHVRKHWLVASQPEEAFAGLVGIVGPARTVEVDRIAEPLCFGE